MNTENLKNLSTYFQGRDELFEESFEKPAEIYLNGQTKFVLSEKTLKLEHLGLALGRCDLLGDKGIDASELDSIRFANEFAALMAERLSLHDLEILTQAFNRELRNSQYRHKKALHDQAAKENTGL